MMSKFGRMLVPQLPIRGRRAPTSSGPLFLWVSPPSSWPLCSQYCSFLSRTGRMQRSTVKHWAKLVESFAVFYGLEVLFRWQSLVISNLLSPSLFFSFCSGSYRLHQALGFDHFTLVHRRRSIWSRPTGTGHWITSQLHYWWVTT